MLTIRNDEVNFIEVYWGTRTKRTTLSLYTIFLKYLNAKLYRSPSEHELSLGSDSDNDVICDAAIDEYIQSLLAKGLICYVRS